VLETKLFHIIDPSLFFIDLTVHFISKNEKLTGTCKVRNEIETKRNETERNQTKSNETKRIFSKTKCNEKKWKIQYGMKTKKVYNILIIQI
jgi:hypothetical protein